MRYLFLGIVIIFSTNLSIASSAINIGIIETALPKDQLLSLTRQNLEVRLCKTCNTSLISLDRNTEFYEANNAISFNQALELSIIKKDNDITIFFDNSTNSLKKIIFGNLPENIDR